MIGLSSTNTWAAALLRKGSIKPFWWTCWHCCTKERSSSLPWCLHLGSCHSWIPAFWYPCCWKRWCCRSCWSHPLCKECCSWTICWPFAQLAWPLVYHLQEGTTGSSSVFRSHPFHPGRPSWSWSGWQVLWFSLNCLAPVSSGWSCTSRIWSTWGQQSFHLSLASRRANMT